MQPEIYLKNHPLNLYKLSNKQFIYLLIICDEKNSGATKGMFLEGGKFRRINHVEGLKRGKAGDGRAHPFIYNLSYFLVPLLNATNITALATFCTFQPPENLFLFYNFFIHRSDLLDEIRNKFLIIRELFVYLVILFFILCEILLLRG